MEIGIDLDDNKAVNYYFDGVNGQIRLDVSDGELEQIKQGTSFKYVDDQLIADPERDAQIVTENRIIELKQKIGDLNSDLTIIMTKQLTGESLSQEDQDLIDLINSYRDEISELES